MSPNVIVDDRDPNVHYGGPGWSRGGTALEFRNTATVSGSTGSTVTYTFNGTAISVWGTIPATMSSSASYSIDGNSPVTVATVIFSEDQVWENLFNWTSLQDGTHTITITTRSGIFSLDFLLVTPSPNASLGGATLMVDDMDPSVEWNPSSQWAAFGTYPEFQNTTHDTTTAGSTMQYTFTGTTVSVWGTIQPDIPSTQYTIDGGAPYTFETPATSSKLFHQLFYASPNLTAGDHTLVVTVNNNSGSVIIDYLLVVASPPPPASSSSIIPTNTASIPGPSQSPSSSATPTAVIASAAAGSTIVLAALTAILVYLFRRRRRRPIVREYFDNESSTSVTAFVPAAAIPLPFYATKPQGRPSAANSTPPAAETEPKGSLSVQPFNSTSGSSTSGSSTSRLLSSDESASAASTSLPVSNAQSSGRSLPEKGQRREPAPPPRLHRDGGVRLEVGLPMLDEHVELAEMPPVYADYNS